MKKICFIADARSPHTQKWIRGCQKLNWEITVVSHNPATIPGVRVIVHPLPLQGFLKYCWSVRKLIRQIKPDIVHAHQFGAHGLYGWFAGCGVLINSAWGSDILLNPNRSRVLRSLVKFLIRHSQVITSDSLQVTAALVELGAKPEQVLTFLFGMERAVVEKLNWIERPASPFIICSPRLHEPLYNLPVILEAFRRLQQEERDLQLWMLGDGSLTPSLQTFVAEHQLQGVAFFGRVSADEALNRIARSHVLVSIPSSDGTPVSMLEAMAAGCLPVVSNLPVYHDWIRNGVNGIIVPIDATGLAEALRKSFTEPGFRQQAAEVNRRLIRDKAIWEDQFQVMLDYYQKAADVS